MITTRGLRPISVSQLDNAPLKCAKAGKSRWLMAEIAGMAAHLRGLLPTAA